MDALLLCAAAQLDGRALEFARAISKVLWDGSITGWHEGDHLANAAAAAGFDLAAMTPPSSPIPIAMSGSLRATNRTTPPQAIGACPLSYSKTSRSSARTASIS
jgi:hypothetical protein